MSLNLNGSSYTRGKKSYFGGDPILPTWSGYAIVICFGVFFSLFTTGIVHLETKYTKTKVCTVYAYALYTCR